MKKHPGVRTILYCFITIVLVATSVFVGRRISLAQGGGGSEPDGNTAQVDLSTTKSHEPSSANEGGTVPSEENLNPVKEGESKEKLTEMTIHANGEIFPSEPQSIMPGTELSNPIKVLESLALPNSPDATFPKHWFGVLAAAFAPSDSSISYVYGGAGCTHATTAGDWRAAVNLPDGAVAKYIYIQYNNPNASAGTSTGWLTRYSFLGNREDIAFVNSRPGSTATGYLYDLSAEITGINVIDNWNYVYGFVWNGSTTQYLCSMQVGFYPPPYYLVNLPVVIK